MRDELAQVGQAGVDQRQVLVVALLAALRTTAGRSYPVQPDAGTQPRAEAA
ncbi:hypothetical protein [Saccharopolyspora sp. CA-218241]|uniref:hypothetical protein n=1 Tax=Saccharopolyspora sp. CA-218241 TaxID=3240027 RepID=UPI003D980A46